jgi:protein-S-isoprenylcysteine O-methyltransferase Ste14
MLEKIYFTVLFVLALLVFGSWILMNVDEKREDKWFYTTLTIQMLMIILVVGGMITSIWLN